MKLLATILLLTTLVSAQGDSNGKTTRALLTPERAVAAARHMRDRLNDPDSLRVITFPYREWGDSYVLCVIFRAKEQGSLVLQRFANSAAEDAPGILNPEDLVWNVMCHGEMVYDATAPVKAALKEDRAKAKGDDE